MKQRVFIFVLLIGAFLYSLVLLNSRQGVQTNSGSLAQNFSLKNENGQVVSLSDFKGKVVLLHFWASWCGPCVEEFPALNQLYRDFKDKDFTLLAVSTDFSWQDVKNFRESVQFDFPVLLDEDQKVVEDYGTYRLPESYLIDKSGKLVRKIIGAQNWESPSWQSEINRVLSL